MMYQVKTAKAGDLAKVKVKNQAKIVEMIGTPLVLEKAYNLIRKETDGFQKSDEKALQADRLLAELLQANGIEMPAPGTESEPTKPSTKAATKTTTEAPGKAIRLRQERERARALELLELELELAA